MENQEFSNPYETGEIFFALLDYQEYNAGIGNDSFLKNTTTHKEEINRERLWWEK